MIPSIVQVLFGALPMSAATTAPPPPAVTATADEMPHRSGLAIGVELGDPASLTAAYFVDKLSFGAAVGSGTLYGPGFSAHVDIQYVAMQLAPHMPLRLGLGGRYYDQHYQPASVDELPQQRWGVRASAQVALEKPSWQLYAELAPGVDLKRSASCNLLDGVNSVCPHAQSTPMFLQFDVGARWFFSH